MDNKLTWLGALRWCRDSFAAWFTTAWLYIILWGVVAIAFTVLLYIDGVFSRSLAPDSIEPLSFQAMGWAYRFFAAAFLMAAARCSLKEIPGRWTFRLLGIFASAIVCLHAFGFGFEALSDKRDNAEIITATQENAQAGTDAILAQLNARKEEIRADLAEAVAPLNAEIERLDTDGLINEDLATIQKERRTALQDAAQARIDGIDERILSLLTPESDEAAAAEARAEAEAEHVEKWHPLFVGLAQASNGTWKPTDNQVYIAAISFVVFWVLLAESLVIFLPERIYQMHLRDAALAEARKGKSHSELTKDGIARKRMQEELDSLREEVSTLRKARTGPDKIIQAGSGLDPQQAEYWADAIVQMLAAREKRPKLTLGYLAEKYAGGRTAEELTGHLQRAARQGWISREQFDKIMQLPKPNGKAADEDFKPQTGDGDADDSHSDQPDQGV